MKILFITMNGKSYPSSRLRVFNYLPYLDGKYEYEVLPFGSEWVHRKGVSLACREQFTLFEKALHKAQSKILRKIDGSHNLLCYLKILFNQKHYDLVYVQKVPIPQRIVRFIKTQMGAKIIFDFDDAIFLDRGRPKQRKKIERYNYLMAAADVVITTSNFNKKYALKHNENVDILLTPVDTERYKPRNSPKQNDKVVIGWVGTPSTTRYLKAFFNVLEKIDRKHSVSFRFIGAVPFKNKLKDIRFLPWEYDTEVQYMQEFDIGIMPLLKEDWALGKAGYKLLQYMAMGIPSVASPWGPNQKILKEKDTGYLPVREAEWIKDLEKLCSDRSLRTKMGNKARSVSVNKYSLKANITKFVSLLHKL